MQNESFYISRTLHNTKHQRKSQAFYYTLSIRVFINYPLFSIDKITLLRDFTPQGMLDCFETDNIRCFHTF